MNQSDIKSAVIAALQSVAPESDAASISESASLRETLDLDSMDFLNFVIALHAALHVDIPEADYSKMQTMRGAIAYLTQKLEVAGQAGKAVR